MCLHRKRKWVVSDWVEERVETVYLGLVPEVPDRTGVVRKTDDVYQTFIPEGCTYAVPS